MLDELNCMQSRECVINIQVVIGYVSRYDIERHHSVMLVCLFNCPSCTVVRVVSLVVPYFVGMTVHYKVRMYLNWRV